jgi:hypothetical protein
VKEEEDEPFMEDFRRFPFNALKELGYDWAVMQDIDERWDISAKDKIRRDVEKAYKKGCKSIRFPMFTAWDEGLRIDTIFNPMLTNAETRRERMFYAKGDWKWLHKIIVAPYYFENNQRKDYKVHFGTAPIIHYGHRTEKLRKMHKKRWDKNYTRAVGNQPYTFWRYINDKSGPVEVAKFEDYKLTKQQ